MPHEAAAVSARSVYTVQPYTMSLHAKPHTEGACVFSRNLPPAFTCYYGGSLAVPRCFVSSFFCSFSLPEKESNFDVFTVRIRVKLPGDI